MKPTLGKEVGETILDRIKDEHGDDDTIFGMFLLASGNKTEGGRIEIQRVIFDDRLAMSRFIPILVNALGEFMHTLNDEAAAEEADDEAHDCGEADCDACRSRKGNAH